MALILKFGSAKTDPVQFKWGFGEVLLKDKFAFKSPIKALYLRGENCLQNAHFYKLKGPCFKNPFKLGRVSFSTSDKFPAVFNLLFDFFVSSAGFGVSSASFGVLSAGFAEKEEAKRKKKTKFLGKALQAVPSPD